MFGREVYTHLVQVLNPKLRYIGNDKSLLVGDGLRDIYALVIYNFKLSRERQVKCLTYPIPELVMATKCSFEIMQRCVRSEIICCLSFVTSDGKAIGMNGQEW